MTCRLPRRQRRQTGDWWRRELVDEYLPPVDRWLLRLYEYRPVFASLAERVYQLAAHHRLFFSKLS